MDDSDSGREVARSCFLACLGFLLLMAVGALRAVAWEMLVGL